MAKRDLFPYAVLFLIAFVALTFEMLLIRTVFAVFPAGMTTSIVAVSSFGFGLGGWMYYQFGARVKENWAVAAALVTAFMAAFFLSTFAFLHAHGFEKQEHAIFLTMALTTLFFAGPGFYAGFIFTNRRGQAGRTYACDLLGACLGALFPLAAMSLWSRETALLISLYLILTLLALSLYHLSARRLAFGLPALLAVAALGHYFLQAPFICANWREENLPVINSPSAMVNINWYAGPLDIARRSELVEIPPADRAKVRAAYNASLDCRGRTMTVDYDDLSALKYSEREIHSLPFALKTVAKGAFFGTGLGMDIVRAQYFGVHEISAFEINPDLLALEKSLLGERSHYAKANVRTFIGDSRRQITLSREKYDLIYISSSKNYGRVGVNANALLLNRLLTLEALQTYWERLTEEGLIYAVDDVPHSRLNVPNFKILFERLGIEDGAAHIAFGEDGSGYSGYLISKVPFTPGHKQRLRQVAEERGWDISFGERLLRTSRPPFTDDRPNVLAKVSLEAERWFVDYSAIGLMIALAMILWPFIKSENAAGRVAGSLFALCCSGALFVSAQIAFLFGLELLFENPLVTVAVTLVLMLVASALGSLLSSKLNERRAFALSLFLAGWLVLLHFTLNGMVHWAYEANLVVRILTAAAIVAPASLLIGTIFPFHLDRLSGHAKYIPLGIGVNGAGILLGGIAGTWIVADQGISAILALNAALAAAAATSLISAHYQR